MKIGKVVKGMLLLGLAVALATGVGLSQAQDPPLPERVQPQGDVSIAATVSSKISYQGVLKENGQPVTGSRDMTFRLYSDSTCSTQVGSDIVKSGVQVTDGLFSVDLDVDQDDFNGQALWLEVEVGGTKIGCQELLPVPYALSLRPGAKIEGPVSGALVEANNTNSIGGTGVFGQSEGTPGFGVFGYASATTGTTYGVHGMSNSTSGRGVYGWATATSGTTYGVYGESESTGGIGVFGSATATSGTNHGVYGRSYSPIGRGVFGLAAATSGTNYGVYGYTNSPSGYGGYFYGNVQVVGDLSVTGSKPFKIDHPLDPANRYLYHFAQEAPQVQNVYNGVVTLDASGQAVVTLPDYFPALNTGPFRYQLTAIGAPMPNLYIAEEIQGNVFKIAGGVPGKKVSWEVTAIRNDPYVRDHPLQAEVDKPADEKGTYIYPEGYGKSKEMGLDYRRIHKLLEQTEQELLSTSSER